MNLTDLGLTDEIKKYVKDNDLSDFTLGRVVQENRERYIVSAGDTSFEAEITGNLRFTADSRSDFPAVGDWVTMTVYDHHFAIIHSIIPRKTVLERQAVGKYGEKQIISTNIDCAFIMQSIDNNFNINRLERYLTICYAAGIEPVLIISKTDLATEAEINDSIRTLKERDKNVKYFLLSNPDQESVDRIADLIVKEKTYCVVGSSGVGKSTLINNLLKRNVLKTREISTSTNKGKHTTGHRELFVLENGGIIIDTPGMKELGMTDNSEGIKTTFAEIVKLSLKCRFPDCRHIDEKECAVIEATMNGLIESESVENFRKILREQEHFQATEAEKRKKDREFGKMIKNVLKREKKA